MDSQVLQIAAGLIGLCSSECSTASVAMAHAVFAGSCAVSFQVLQIAAELIGLCSSESSTASVAEARAVIARSCAVNF